MQNEQGEKDEVVIEKSAMVDGKKINNDISCQFLVKLGMRLHKFT